MAPAAACGDGSAAAGQAAAAAGLLAGAFPQGAEEQIAADFPFLASGRGRSRGFAGMPRGMQRMLQGMQRGLKPLSTHWEQRGGSSSGEVGLGLGSDAGELELGSLGRQSGLVQGQGLSLGMLRLEAAGSRPGSRQQERQGLLG
jgi:hypothetical protein